MAVADATSASGAIATSRPDAPAAVRGLAHHAGPVPARGRGAPGRTGRLASCRWASPWTGPTPSRRDGRCHADARGRRGALRRTGRRRCRRLVGVPPRRARARGPPGPVPRTWRPHRGGEAGDTIAAEPDLTHPSRAAAVTRIAEDPAGPTPARSRRRAPTTGGASRWVRRTSGRPPTHGGHHPACGHQHLRRRRPPALRRLRRRHVDPPPLRLVVAVGATVLVLLLATQVLVDLADQAAPQRGAARRHGAGGSTRCRGRWSASTRRSPRCPLPAGGLRPAHRPLDGPDPGAAVAQRRQPPPHRAGDGYVRPRRTSPRSPARVEGDGTVAARHATALAERTGSTTEIERIRRQWADYMAVHDQVRQLDDAGQYLPAVERRRHGRGRRRGPSSTKALAAEITAAETGLDAEAAATPTATCAGWRLRSPSPSWWPRSSCVTGLWVRIKEYR